MTSNKIWNDIDSKERIAKFIECQEIFPLEQKEYKKESYGYEDQLLINKMIMKNFWSKQKKISFRFGFTSKNLLIGYPTNGF